MSLDKLDSPSQDKLDVEKQPLVSLSDMQEFLNNQKRSVSPLHYMNDDAGANTISTQSRGPVPPHDILLGPPPVYDKARARNEETLDFSQARESSSSPSWLDKLARQVEAARAADLLKNR